MAPADLDKKQDELQRLQARRKPLAIILGLCAAVMMVSATAGGAVGLPRGLYVYLLPVLAVLVLVWVPLNRRMGQLAKEIKALNEER